MMQSLLSNTVSRTEELMSRHPLATYVSNKTLNTLKCVIISFALFHFFPLPFFSKTTEQLQYQWSEAQSSCNRKYCSKRIKVAALALATHAKCQKHSTLPPAMVSSHPIPSAESSYKPKVHWYTLLDVVGLTCHQQTQSYRICLISAPTFIEGCTAHKETKRDRCRYCDTSGKQVCPLPGIPCLALPVRGLRIGN